MTEEQIKKEYIKLMSARIEAVTVCNYYQEQHLQVLLQANKLLKEWKDREETENLSSEEQEKWNVDYITFLAQMDASDVLSKLLGRLKDKAQRKSNEINQRFELFCKRHGIVDELVE